MWKGELEKKWITFVNATRGRVVGLTVYINS